MAIIPKTVLKQIRVEDMIGFEVIAFTLGDIAEKCKTLINRYKKLKKP